MNESTGEGVPHAGRWDWVPAEQPSPPTPGAPGRWHVVQDQAGTATRWEWVPAAPMAPAPFPAPPGPVLVPESAQPVAAAANTTLGPWLPLLVMIAAVLGIGLLVVMAAPTTSGRVLPNPATSGHGRMLIPPGMPGYPGAPADDGAIAPESS